MTKKKTSSSKSGCFGAIVTLIAVAFFISILPWIGLAASIVCLIVFAVKLSKESKTQGKKRSTTIGVAASAGALIVFGAVIFLVPSGSTPETVTTGSKSSSVSSQVKPSSSPGSSPLESSIVEPVSEISDPVSATDIPEQNSEIHNSENVEPPTASTAPIPEPSPKPAATEYQANMVWISNQGAKYHRKASCSNMEDPWQVSLEEAEAMGRSACKKCY